jgi:hypothetical protein
MILKRVMYFLKYNLTVFVIEGRVHWLSCSKSCYFSAIHLLINLNVETACCTESLAGPIRQQAVVFFKSFIQRHGQLLRSCSVDIRWMNVYEALVDDTNRGKPKRSAKNLSHLHFARHKSHTDGSSNRELITAVYKLTLARRSPSETPWKFDIAWNNWVN